LTTAYLSSILLVVARTIRVKTRRIFVLDSVSKLRAHWKENSVVIHDDGEDTGVVSISPLPLSLGVTDDAMVTIGVGNPTGEAASLLFKSWDSIDNLIDQIEIAAQKAFGDRPVTPVTPNLLT
jgi:hypothetical protein